MFYWQEYFSFEVPKAPAVLQGIRNATSYGPTCAQQSAPPGLPFAAQVYPSVFEERLITSRFPSGLTVDVFRPESSTGAAKLPVFVFIYGGGFEVGNSRDNDMKPLLERSIERGELILIVMPNYRVSALGYLAGKEVAAAGKSNLALRNLIFALEWLQRHISAFGGDPNRVVTGGVSAGSISSALLWLNNPQRSNKLFHGVFLQSGPAIPFPPLSTGQAGYDRLAAATNCSTSGDTLECLRRVPLDTLMAAVNTTADFESFWSLNLILILVAICDDEGTYLPSISDAEMAGFTRLYPADPSQGSPFNTGTDTSSRDYIMSAPRRFLLEHAALNVWGSLNKVGKATNSPIGAAHASDGPIRFSTSTKNGTVSIDVVLLNFINTLDPNRPANESTGDTSVSWQTWNTPSSSGDSSLLMFTDTGIDVTADVFRKEVIDFLNGLRLEDATE
ncbi:carotenoid ester lipase precursor [Mycena albidolilacea]|uniref:Carotenoid ester lipase n=1 Tax=Mycena albidolilacea TaxID=1033008 RepID=A0AAD6Z4B4_9AGAR|nr:carotenoid ester lipase precursor [Mycena albidolilacea]